MTGVTVRFRLPDPRFIGSRRQPEIGATTPATRLMDADGAAIDATNTGRIDTVPRPRTTSSLARRLALAHYSSA